MSQRPPRLLCLSQPAVTRSIHRLEESLGCKLFTRVSRGVRLTVEGAALFSHVDSAFKSLSNGERELKRLAAFEAGTPIIGAAETPLYHFLLPKLGQFREMHPNVTLQVQGSSTHETIQMLRAEQADVVPAVSPLTDVEDLSVTELASFRDVFVAGPRFKSLAIGILPSLFAQSLLAQEGFFALDTDPIPARQILLVHRGEGRTSLLCILTSSKRKKPCHNIGVTISNIRPECFSFSLPLLQSQKRFLATSANKAFAINRPVRFSPLLRSGVDVLAKSR